MATQWFQSVFGFAEGTSYGSNRSHFEYDEATATLRCGGRSFHVGSFTTPTVLELREVVARHPPDSATLGGITFKHLTNCNVASILKDPKNQGAVVQAASQFNCLEMVGPGVTPEQGISMYALDPTQGPQCAMSCAAGTAYRNYIHPDGRGQGGGDARQVNTMRGVERLLRNDAHQYWTMRNGYLLPADSTKMAELTERIGPHSSDMARRIVEHCTVGVHWDTEVAAASKHRVCQVYASATPVNYAKSTTSKDWSSLSCLILEAAYELTLLAGAVLAAKENRRVTIYLTSVGGGAFANRHEWIRAAIERALWTCRMYPLDVRMANFGGVVPSGYKTLVVPRAEPPFLIGGADHGKQSPPPQEEEEPAAAADGGEQQPVAE